MKQSAAVASVDVGVPEIIKIGPGQYFDGVVPKKKDGRGSFLKTPCE